MGYMSSVLKGMWITFKHQFRPRITLNYPFEFPPLPAHFRGFLKLEGVVGEDPVPQRSEVLPPCAQGCPAHVDACGYINLTANGNELDAYYLHMLSNPLPATFGRICYAPCEPVCRRGGEEEEIQIRAIKRYMADKAFEMFDKGEALPPQPPNFEHDQSVAVIGSGPAGLSAAYYLRQMGYTVTVYERETVPGGMMTLGIPEYRLPREIIYREVKIIEDTGVKFEYGKSLGIDFTVDSLFEMGHKAVFLGVGAHVPIKLGLPGEDDFPQVMPGETFLREVALGNAPAVGKRVMVVGAGNTAMDCARVSRRLGAEVHVSYRRSRSEAPAVEHEIAEAEEEAVEMMWQTLPTGFTGEDGSLTKARLMRTELGAPDEKGRRSPVPVEGSEFDMEVDLVLTALSRVGSWYKGKALGWLEGTGIDVDKRGAIMVDPGTMATTRAGVFSGGDAGRGPTVAIAAIGDGHRAALAIDEWLRTGELVPQDIAPRVPIAEKTRFHPRPVPAVKLRKVDPKLRVQSFVEEENPYTKEEVVFEAERCLSCMTRACIGCAICAQMCPDKCITMEILQDDQQRIVDEFNILHDLCCYCGLCTEACPTKTLVHTTEINLNTFTHEELNFGRQQMLRRTDEKPVAPDGMTRWSIYRVIDKQNPGGGHAPMTLQGTHPGRATVDPMQTPGSATEFARPAEWRESEIERVGYPLRPDKFLTRPAGSEERLWSPQYPQQADTLAVLPKIKDQAGMPGRTGESSQGGPSGPTGHGTGSGEGGSGEELAANGGSETPRDDSEPPRD